MTKQIIFGVAPPRSGTRSLTSYVLTNNQYSNMEME